LELEKKKSFVSQKNFKEAGRVSNELKSFNEKKIKNIEMISSTRKSIEDLLNQNKAIDKKIGNTEFDPCPTEDEGADL